MHPEKLHVVAVYSNPRRYESRMRLLKEFIPHMLDSGVHLTLVEHAYGERPHQLRPLDTDPRVNLIQVRGGASQELWIKEAMIKVGVRSLPAHWKYLAWIDADLKFERPDWASETLEMLQLYRVVQPWSHAIDLGPNRQVMTNEWGHDVDRSFAAAWMAGDVDVPVDGYDPTCYGVSRALLANDRAKDYRQHYGFAWAMRRDVWDGIGGLPDWLVTGSADYHTALAFAGKLRASEAYMSPGCVRRFRELAERCHYHVRQDIGCVQGMVVHGFHGPKRKRYYLTRKAILEESRFCPDRDLTYDWQGIPSLAENRDNRLLRDGLRRLNVLRDEDSREEG